MPKVLIAAIGVIVGLSLGSAITYAIMATRDVPALSPPPNPTPSPSPAPPTESAKAPAPRRGSTLPSDLPSGINPGRSMSIRYDKFEHRTSASASFGEDASLLIGWPGEPKDLLRHDSRWLMWTIIDEDIGRDDDLFFLLDDSIRGQLSPFGRGLFKLDYDTTNRLLKAAKVEFKVGLRTETLTAEQRKILHDALTFLSPPPTR